MDEKPSLYLSRKL